MNTRQSARILGRRGGLARAKSLSLLQKRKIASLGGLAKSLSSRAAKRIEDNFRYVQVVEELKRLAPS